MQFSSLKYSFLRNAIAIIFISTSFSIFANSELSSSTLLAKRVAALEKSMGGRIGIFAMNTANDQPIQYRASERFPLQSTFKVMAVAAILKQSMANKQLLQQKIPYTKKDLVFWSPITEKHFAEGMTLFDLCSAAMVQSDNTAANLIVKMLGGPEAVTAFARSIGDNGFRLDSWEPELNSDPSNLGDTSTPRAMGKNLQTLTLEDILASPQREQLVSWMKSSTTGGTRIRAGVPKGWIVADKTGSGNHYGIANDIAIIWPPSCAPIVIAIYSVHNKKGATSRDDILTSVTRLVMKEFAKNDECIRQKYD